MNYLEINNSVFERIKYIDEDGKEYWHARDLMKALQYRKWQNFELIIKKAIYACKNSSNSIQEHFTENSKVLEVGNGAKMSVRDYKLSRYACYLIVQNGNPQKEPIALGQTYFAIQTRKQELREKDYNTLTEIEKRFYQRDLTRKGNYTLNQAAKNIGVKNFDKFHNYGYKGLYNGETANDIAKRKGLRYREDILDNMNSDELIINLFRISQTNQKLINDHIQGEKQANHTHYKMGKDIRNFIKKQGGIMPEDLPTPSKSLKELGRENKISTKE